MIHKVFLFMLLGVYCVVDSGKASLLDIQEQGPTDQVKDVCAGIIGANWNVGKQDQETPCKTLNVWVPKKLGFTEFVNVNEELEVEGGFSIAIFCYALQALPYPMQPTFIPFVIGYEKNASYAQFLMQIKEKNCHAVAGDLSIRLDRAQHVSFTTPYLSSEVYMVVRASHEWNQTLWTFLKPFTRRLWIAIFGVCILTGTALALLEYRAGNPKFIGPFPSQLRMVIWFPLSTFFFQEGRIHNRNSKAVVVMWLSMLFIVIQIFTATLSSWLTLDQLRPRLTNFENFGYQDGSFLKDFIINKYKSSGQKLLPLKNVEEYKNALSSGIVDAIFDELPYIELFLAKYGSDYMKIGPINQESGIAFAFPRGTAYLEEFSRAVINVTESEIMMEMKKKYLGFSTPEKSISNDVLPRSLDVESFIGLFILMGIVIIAAIILSEISLIYSYN